VQLYHGCLFQKSLTAKGVPRPGTVRRRQCCSCRGGWAKKHVPRAYRRGVQVGGPIYSIPSVSSRDGSYASQGPVKVQHTCNGGCPWRSLVKSPGTRLGEAQCRRSREFPLSEAQRAEFREFERSARPRTGRRFHTASERDIPQYKDQCLIHHFDVALLWFLTWIDKPLGCAMVAVRALQRTDRR
jgi:hypothetical protein